jgi:hypothetical protein
LRRITGLAEIAESNDVLHRANPWGIRRLARQPLMTALRFTYRFAPPRLLGVLVTLVAGAAWTTTVSAQQHAPSREELRSMYCVEVIRAEIDLQQHMISASADAAGRATTPEQRQQWIDTGAELIQGLAKLQGVLYRFQAHMLPRIRELDSSALAEAIRLGNSAGAVGRAGECENPTWLSL